MTPRSERCSVVGTYCLHAHDGLLHLGDIRDVVLVRLELLLLNPFVDADHQLPGDVSPVIHTYGRGTGKGRGCQGPGAREGAPLPDCRSRRMALTLSCPRSEAFNGWLPIPAKAGMSSFARYQNYYTRAEHVPPAPPPAAP